VAIVPIIAHLMTNTPGRTLYFQGCCFLQRETLIKDADPGTRYACIFFASIPCRELRQTVSLGWERVSGSVFSTQTEPHHLVSLTITDSSKSKIWFWWNLSSLAGRRTATLSKQNRLRLFWHRRLGTNRICQGVGSLNRRTGLNRFKPAFDMGKIV